MLSDAYDLAKNFPSGPPTGVVESTKLESVIYTLIETALGTWRFDDFFPMLKKLFSVGALNASSTLTRVCEKQPMPNVFAEEGFNGPKTSRLTAARSKVIPNTFCA